MPLAFTQEDFLVNIVNDMAGKSRECPNMAMVSFCIF